MNRLSRARRAKILHCLLEGLSIASTARLTETAEPTISRLQMQAGMACMTFHDSVVRKLRCRQIQCDEMWNFIYAKEKNKPYLSPDAPDVTGTIWLWIAVCSKTRLIIDWRLGDRKTKTAVGFLKDVKRRLDIRRKDHLQIATDGHSAYAEAISKVFGDRVEHARLIKTWSTKGWGDGEERNGDRYPRNLKILHQLVGLAEDEETDPNPVSTSYVERVNLSFRMEVRRCTRRTNGYSKRLANHAMAIALYITYYNFARIHESLKQTPAMKAKVAKGLLYIDDIVRLLEQYDSQPGPRGPYRKTRKRLKARKKAERKRLKKRKAKLKRKKIEKLVGVDSFENVGRPPGPPRRRQSVRRQPLQWPRRRKTVGRPIHRKQSKK